MGANLVFLKHLESLIHEIGNQIFFRADGAKDQIIAFQLWEEDRLHLKGRNHFRMLQDVLRTRAGRGTRMRQSHVQGTSRIPAPSFLGERALSLLPLKGPFIFLVPTPQVSCPSSTLPGPPVEVLHSALITTVTKCSRFAMRGTEIP